MQILGRGLFGGKRYLLGAATKPSRLSVPKLGSAPVVEGVQASLLEKILNKLNIIEIISKKLPAAPSRFLELLY